MATAYRDLVDTTKGVLEAHHAIKEETKNLVRATRALVWATWGIAVATLITVGYELLKK